MTENDILITPNYGDDLEKSELDDISGEIMQLNQTSATRITGTHIELYRSAALNIGAEDILVDNSAILYAEGGEVQFEKNNWVVLSNSSEIIINESQAGTILAGSVKLNKSTAGILISRDIRADAVRTGILFAGHVEGPVITIIDTSRALLAGLVSGITVGLVIWLGKILSNRRRS